LDSEYAKGKWASPCLRFTVEQTGEEKCHLLLTPGMLKDFLEADLTFISKK